MNIPSGRSSGWVEHRYLRFHRVEKLVQRGGRVRARLFTSGTAPSCEAIIAYRLCYSGNWTRSRMQRLSAPQKVKRDSGPSARTPVLLSRTYKTVLCGIFKRRNWSPGTFNPLRLATGATATPITEGRNVQKEAETLELDFRNKEELSFGKEQTAEPLLFLHFFVASN